MVAGQKANENQYRTGNESGGIQYDSNVWEKYSAQDDHIYF